MKVLMISTDRKILEENSEVRQTMIEYGSLAEELHVVVFTKRQSQISNLKSQNFGNIFIYPTNSWSKWLYVFSAVKIGEKILASDGQWLITSQDPFETGLAGYKLTKKSDIPLQLQIHTDFLNPYFVQHSMLNRLRVKIAKFLIPRATCIRVVSERIKKSILGRLNLHGEVQPPIIVLPVFVDVKKIQEVSTRIDLHQKYPQFNFIILIASRLTKEKNISLAIEAVKDLVKKYPKIGLIVVGDGPEKNNLKFKIKNLKLHDNVVFEPWSNDLISYYKTCDVFLLTSNYEGYGRTAVEALASGSLVIMTDVGVAGDITKDGYNSLIVPVGDKIGLERAIEKMINDRALHAKLSLSSENLIYKMLSKKEYLEKLKKSWEICR